MNTKALACLFVFFGITLGHTGNVLAMVAKRPHAIARRRGPVFTEEGAANKIEAALGHCRKIVKMLTTGTDRGGVLIGYVPAGPSPVPVKLICDVEFTNKTVLDEYYYAAGRLLFVRETVCTYPRQGSTFDIAHPDYKKPVDISFLGGRIAGPTSMRQHYGTLTSSSTYLLGVLRSTSNPADVAQWVKGEPVSNPVALTAARTSTPVSVSPPAMPWRRIPARAKARATWKPKRTTMWARKTSKWAKKGKGRRVWRRPRRAVRRW